MANLSHCPLSRCQTQPGYCEMKASDEDFLGLLFIILLPIFIAVFAPGIARGGVPCRSDDDTPHLRTRDIRGIDPPMFLCGIGLIPLDCGLSGLLTVAFAMGSGFAVLFFAMLTSARPCTTALGACRTISCACGNLIPEGYVFMFCMLTLTSAFLVQRFSSFVQHNRIQHKTLKPTLVLGSLLLCLTGIFPERYDANGLMGGYLSWLYTLHLLGIAGSAFALMIVPFAWFAEHWLTHRKEVPLRSLLARFAYVLATVGFGVGFSVLASDSEISDQVNPFCSALKTAHECNNWPQLTSHDCARALSCIANGTAGDGPSDDLCEGQLQPNYRCSWEANSELSAWTRLVAPPAYAAAASCVRTQCPLTEYARGVALEFAVLMLTLCYVATFTLHDMRRLLDRPPRDQTSARGGVACAPTAIESVQPLSSAQLGLLSAAPP
jgi:hypothetical protein